MPEPVTAAPSREQLLRLNRRFIEIFESGDADRLDEIVAQDFVDHDPGPGTTPDRQGLKDWLNAVRAAFSNTKFTIEDEVVEGDKLVVRGRLSGRHTGPFQGMPASNKDYSIGSIDIIRVRDGKAVEHWGVADTLKMLQQLGFAEAPGQPPVAVKIETPAAAPR